MFIWRYEQSYNVSFLTFKKRERACVYVPEQAESRSEQERGSWRGGWESGD